MAFNHFYYIIRISNIFFYVMTDYFSFVISRKNCFFHHTFANGSHLRTVFRIHNCSYNVTTKSRTNLIQQVFVSLSFFLILMVTDFK